MHSITLATYALQIRRERTVEPIQLGDFNHVDSFAKLFEEYVQALKTSQSVDSEHQSVQQVLRVESKAGRVWGVLNAGDFGYSSDLVNVKTLKSAHKRGVDEAELIPFYFALSANHTAKTAILVLQRHGPRGVFTEFMTTFRKWFRTRCPEYNFDVRRLVPADVIRHLIEGELKSIELRTYDMSGDLANQVRAFGNLKGAGALTVKVDAKRNAVLPRPAWLKNIINKKIKLVDIPEELDWGENRMRIGVEFQGHKRMVDFHRPESIAPYLDVTKSVKLGADGHPVFDSIHAYALQLLQDLEAEVGVD